MLVSREKSKMLDLREGESREVAVVEVEVIRTDVWTHVQKNYMIFATRCPFNQG